MLGCARTGTGKTAAFVLPTLARWLAWRADPASKTQTRTIHTLVLAPTRELAAQIGESIATYGKHTSVRHVVIFGGVSQNRQTDELRKGVDIVVATPGRLCDLIDQRLVRLGDIHTLVLDEFDRMLDQGFLPAIKRVLKELPVQRQTLLFSATMPEALESIVKRIVRDPVRISVSKTSSTPTQIEQRVSFVEQPEKRYVLEHLLRRGGIARAVVFTRTKHGANRVAEYLQRAGIDAEAIPATSRQRRFFFSDTAPRSTRFGRDDLASAASTSTTRARFHYDIRLIPRDTCTASVAPRARAVRIGDQVVTREDRPTSAASSAVRPVAAVIDAPPRVRAVTAHPCERTDALRATRRAPRKLKRRA